MLMLDHIAIASTSLDKGAKTVENALGLKLEGGGQHAAMGTHNQLLSLGPDYLEVIAIDPKGTRPLQPRWFELDTFAGPARPIAWVCRCDDLAAARFAAPPGTGEPLALARADLHWRMAVPPDGKLPFDGLFPALMQWDSTAHPTHRLQDHGARLVALQLHSPQAEALEAALAPLIDDSRIAIVPAAVARLQVTIAGPSGNIFL